VKTPNWLEGPFRAHTLASANSRPFIDIDDGRALAQAIVDTIREPLLVLDNDLRVVTANRSFYLMFRMKETRPASARRSMTKSERTLLKAADKPRQIDIILRQVFSSCVSTMDVGT
jgi:PAS domain-containing protein